MGKTISDLMTKNPRTMSADATVQNAAQTMRDENIGNVLVERDGKLCGIVTDRDLVIRGIADGRDPAKSKLGELCSEEVTTASPDNTVDDVIEAMRRRAVRRVPVVEDGKAVGIVSLGDLAIERDDKSVLGRISAASATH